MSQLASLSRLDQLTLSDNPCVAQPEQVDRQYDYRPYVINWCLGLRLLDGLPVGAKESLKVSSQWKERYDEHRFGTKQWTDLDI